MSHTYRPCIYQVVRGTTTVYEERSSNAKCMHITTTTGGIHLFTAAVGVDVSSMKIRHLEGRYDWKKYVM